MRIKASIVHRKLRVREGRGFSLGEVEEAGLTVGKARLLGIPVDTRRRSIHVENVERIKESSPSAETRKSRHETYPKRVNGRAFRGLTSQGKKMRGLKR